MKRVRSYNISFSGIEQSFTKVRKPRIVKPVYMSKIEFLIMHAKDMGFECASELMLNGFNAIRCNCGNECCTGWNLIKTGDSEC